jgi:hypothetical protein
MLFNYVRGEIARNYYNGIFLLFERNPRVQGTMFGKHRMSTLSKGFHITMPKLVIILQVSYLH